jgi:hypothetical protein
MLTEGDLFFHNLATEYRELIRVKTSTGVSDAWVREEKDAEIDRSQQLISENSDDDAAMLEATSTTSSATSKSSKKRDINSHIAVVPRAQAPSSKRSRKASRLGDPNKVRGKVPTVAQTSCRYGGLEDEDDTEECEAIMQSPVKEQGVCISDHVSHHYVPVLTPC